MLEALPVVSHFKTASNAVEELWGEDLGCIANDLMAQPVWKRNQKLCEKVLIDVLPNWRQDLMTNESLNNPWTKIRKRIVKELNESEPFIQYIIDAVNSDRDVATYAVIDLCSGFGITSMLLSELLPKRRVENIWLLDKSFPLDFDKVESHHISVEHITNRVWPVPLRIRKVDLKRTRQVKQLHNYVFKGEAKFIMVGIHLCKALSVHAINLYQSTPKAVALLLKPCCLPGKRNLYFPHQGKTKPIEYCFKNGYSFRAIDLYGGNNEDLDVENKSTTTAVGDNHTLACNLDMEATQRKAGVMINNPHQDKNFTNERFSLWIEHLCRGCEMDHCDVRVAKIQIQLNHFQNQFIFCQQVLYEPAQKMSEI